MPKKQPQDFRFQLVNIEKVGNSLNLPKDLQLNTNFTFNIKVESRLDMDKKLIVNMVDIEIYPQEQEIVIGSLTTSYWFIVDDFDSVVSHKGILDIPEPLKTVLNSISISTARGMLYAQFSGTALQKVILPIVDPSKPDPQ